MFQAEILLLPQKGKKLNGRIHLVYITMNYFTQIQGLMRQKVILVKWNLALTK